MHFNKLAGFKAFDEDKDGLEDFLERNNFYEKNEYDIVEKYLEPDLIKIEIEPKLKDDPIFKISLNDFYRITGQENKIKENGEKEIIDIKESELNRKISKSDVDLNKYNIDIEREAKIVQVTKKPEIFSFNEKDMNKFLGKDDEEILKFYGLKLPSYYKDSSLEEFQKAFEIGLKELNNIKSGFKTKVIYESNFDTGLLEAKPSAKIRINKKVVESTKDFNTLQKFNDNMRRLKLYKEKTGRGIIHFNNPLQLLDRLELLAGSIFAGNNGVKQEFS